ncbi:Wdr65 [Symbiodinium necroappetens]|uniref:Wdr65 protein n=1 Tax=Symbiodinium necroappetens TaxID=1628268 RepID=A0A813CAA1_9DINO|nr:Wdr65 [Symbiodinium necroappetens]
MADAFKLEQPKEAPARTKARQRRTDLRRRVDAAVTTMMEGYAAAVEACKVGSSSERAVNAYVQSTYEAAMARAADELRRIGGELALARRAEERRLDRLQSYRKELEDELEAVEENVNTISRTNQAAWLLTSALDTPEKLAEETWARRRRRPHAGAQPESKRLQLPWSEGVFRQGGNAVLEGKGPF